MGHIRSGLFDITFGKPALLRQLLDRLRVVALPGHRCRIPGDSSYLPHDFTLNFYYFFHF